MRTSSTWLARYLLSLLIIRIPAPLRFVLPVRDSTACFYILVFGGCFMWDLCLLRSPPHYAFLGASIRDTLFVESTANVVY